MKQVKRQPNNFKEFIADAIVTYLEDQEEDLYYTRQVLNSWITASTLNLKVFACYNCKSPIIKDDHVYYKCTNCEKNWCCDCNAGITNHNLISDCPNNDLHNDEWCKRMDCFLSLYYPTIKSKCSDCLTSLEIIRLRNLFPNCKCLNEIMIIKAKSLKFLHHID